MERHQRRGFLQASLNLVEWKSLQARWCCLCLDSRRSSLASRRSNLECRSSRMLGRRVEFERRSSNIDNHSSHLTFRSSNLAFRSSYFATRRQQKATRSSDREAENGQCEQIILHFLKLQTLDLCVLRRACSVERFYVFLDQLLALEDAVGIVVESGVA